MLKNIIGAAVGSSLAKSSTSIGGVTGGATGAAIASAIPFVVSRFSIPAMVAIGVGGYFAKRYYDKRKTETESSPAPAKATPNSAKNKPVPKTKNAKVMPQGEAKMNGSSTPPHAPQITGV